MQKNNGVTLITVIVMVIIIIILTSIFMASGLDSIDQSKEGKIKYEKSQIKEAIADEYTNYIKNSDRTTLTGTLAKTKWENSEDCINKIKASLSDDDYENADEKAKVESKIENDIKRDYEQYVMIINSADKQKLGLENFSNDYVFIVNYFVLLVSKRHIDLKCKFI